jgi:hypothetical protein
MESNNPEPPHGRYPRDFSSSPTLTSFLDSLTSGSPLRAAGGISPLNTSAMSTDENVFSSNYFETQGRNNYMPGQMGHGPGRGSGGHTMPHMPSMPPLPLNMMRVDPPAPSPQQYASSSSHSIAPTQEIIKVKLENNKSHQYLQQFHLLQQQHQQQLMLHKQPPLNQSLLPSSDASPGGMANMSAMSQPYLSQRLPGAKVEPDLDGDMGDEANKKAALSAGAVNAARARKRINESFKHLADLCACNRSKKPSILLSAIDKIQRLESRVR